MRRNWTQGIFCWSFMSLSIKAFMKSDTHMVHIQDPDSIVPFEGGGIHTVLNDSAKTQKMKRKTNINFHVSKRFPYKDIRWKCAHVIFSTGCWLFYLLVQETMDLAKYALSGWYLYSYRETYVILANMKQRPMKFISSIRIFRIVEPLGGIWDFLTRVLTPQFCRRFHTLLDQKNFHQCYVFTETNKDIVTQLHVQGK